MRDENGKVAQKDNVAESKADVTSLLASYVASEITRLYAGKDTGSVRAELAELRRFAGKSIDLAPSIMKHIYLTSDSKFHDLPEWDKERVENVVFTVLTLYAVHSQGGGDDKSPANIDSRKTPFSSFAQVAGKLRRELADSSAGLTRRFESILSTNRPNEINYHAKTIVSMLKSKNVGFDYVKFAIDLYWLQSSSPKTRHKVLRRWGREYWSAWQIVEDATLSEGGDDE
jgi:CRISPR system Cascade subunit CasB